MKRRRSAISSSRPSAGPSPWATASEPHLRREVVVDDQPDRHVGRDHLPGRAGREELPPEPARLLAAEDAGGIGEGGFPVLAVRSPVAAHVDHEEVQERPPADPPVDALALDRVGGEGRELEHRPLRPGRQQPGALDRVPGVLDHALVKPVVRHLVVVPLDVLRDLGVEAPDVLVREVVAVVAAELLDRLGDLRLLLGHEVLPRAAARQVDLGLERVVRVDHVAAVHEEVRLQAAHHLVQAHAAPVRADAPTLAGGVAGPRERDVPAVRRAPS